MTDIYPIIRENQKEAWRIVKDLGQPNGEKQYGGDMIEFDFDSIPREDDDVYFSYPCVVASDWEGEFHAYTIDKVRVPENCNSVIHFHTTEDEWIGISDCGFGTENEVYQFLANVQCDYEAGII